jgi:MinD-like ATPase involved in chromosome partitioning or flagellar assembly
MSDQAHQLRKLVRTCVHADATLAPGGPVIAVTGAQPAAGATTIACGLARELASLGKQVILIDANLHHPDVATHFGVEHRGTLHDVLDGTRRAVEVLSPTDEENLRFLAAAPAACGLAPPLDREALDRFTTETASLSRQADFVLIDSGHGMNAWIDRLWQLSRQVLLVATPTAQSLLDAYAAVKLSQHHRHDGRVRLLTNGAEDEFEAAPLAKRFEETCQRFLCIKPKPAAWLPAHSPQRQQGSDQYQRALRLLAADLIGDLRATNLRIPKPKSNDQRSFAQNFNLEDLTQRRRDAEGMQRF